MKLDVTVRAGRLYSSTGAFLGTAERGMADGRYTVDFPTTPALTPAQAAAPLIFDEAYEVGTPITLTGDKFRGTGEVTARDGGDVIVTITNNTKPIRVKADEVHRMLRRLDAVTGGRASRLFARDATVYAGPDGLRTPGTTFYLDGRQFRGLVTVETVKNGDVIGRLALCERTGRTNVRVRVLREDYTAGRVRRVAASASNFRAYQRVNFRGNQWSGPATVEKTKADGSVVIRMSGGRRNPRTGLTPRVNVNRNDLAAGKLTPA